jgi:hypothetical protein
MGGDEVLMYREVEHLRARHPDFAFGVREVRGRRRFEAVRVRGGGQLYALAGADLAEIAAELDAARG